jgi:predicted transcriptional regulator
MTATSIVLSINPRFTAMIFDGAKTVELRRVKPRVSPGDLIYVYESSPTMAVVGYCVVTNVLCHSVEGLWRKVRAAAGVTREEFLTYFQGVEAAFGICISDAIRFEDPLTLYRLRSAHPGFQPPQSHRYVTSLSHPMIELLRHAQTESTAAVCGA